LTAEWRARLWPGDLALHAPPMRRFDQDVQVVRVSDIDMLRGRCRVSFFQPAGGWNGHLAVLGKGLDSSDVRVQRLGACVRSCQYWDWKLQHEDGVPLADLQPHNHSGRPRAVKSGAANSHSALQQHLRRKAVVQAHCPQGHAMMSQTTIGSRSWGVIGGRFTCRCGICGGEISKEDQRLECSSCNFYLCRQCDRHGLLQGYFSLGAVDGELARSLLQEPDWISYKARRYMAAAGSAKGVIGLDLWLDKVAARVFGDFGVQLPPEMDLVTLYRRFSHGDGDGGDICNGLDEEEFCDLLFQLLAAHSVAISL